MHLMCVCSCGDVFEVGQSSSEAVSLHFVLHIAYDSSTSLTLCYVRSIGLNFFYS